MLESCKTLSRRDKDFLKLSSTTYTIQMASTISGVGVHTIRAWEKRYKALVPRRDALGHRVYSKIDVEKLMLLSELCLLGYTISKVAAFTIPELKELLKDLGKTEESFKEADFNLITDTKLTVDTGQSLPILHFALKNYKLDVISQELGKLKMLLSPKEFILDILTPLSLSLTQGHSTGAYTATQEQAVRALFRYHMGHHLYHSIEKKEKANINIVISGIEGSFDDFDLGAIALLCSHYGFHYTYLGANTGSEVLGDIAKSLGTNVVIVGLSNTHGQVGKTHFQNYIEKISGKLNPGTELVLLCHSDLDLDKVSTKRLVVLKTLSAVDEYLGKKNH